MYQDTFGHSIQIPQTMAGVEIDIFRMNSKHGTWRSHHFNGIPPSAMLESQAKLNEILGRHFEDTNQTGR
jgi:hypothetical protein